SREAGSQRVPPSWTALAAQFSASSLGLFSRTHKPIPEIETAPVSMQKAPASSGSPCLLQDPALAPTPTMPPPEDPSEDHEHNQSPAEARLLALHNVSFLELLTAYRNNRQEGLKRYGRYLSLQTFSSSASTQLAQYLQALSTYMEGLLEGCAPDTAEGRSAPFSGQSLVKKASQQT
ncbi:Protein PML, partial [Lemmus lemmus]